MKLVLRRFICCKCSVNLLCLYTIDYVVLVLHIDAGSQMLVRVRGAGASAENSQAVVMHMRAFKHHVDSHSSHPSSSSSGGAPPLNLHSFPVTIDCSHSKFLPTWHEVWNLYDIAYDDVDAALSTAATSGAPLMLVHHLLKFSDAHSALSAYQEAEAAVMLIKSAGKLVLNALGQHGESSILLSTVWQLSYASLLVALAAHHCDDSLQFSPIKEVVLLYANAAPVHSFFLHQFAEELFRPFSTESFTVRVLSSVHAFTTDSADRVVCFMPDTDSEWVGDASDAIQRCPVLRVPIRDYMSGDHLSAMSLQELAAVAKENMVMNFCPCCGPTDGGGCCGHTE
jgi:hypothetical protein